MSGRRKADVLPSLALAVVAAVYVWASYDYDLASQTLPWIAGALAMALALIDVVSKGSGDVTGRLRTSSTADGGRAREAEQRPAVPHSLSQEGAAFAWIGGFLPLVVVLGFYASILLYVFCYLRLYARKGAMPSAAAAFGVAAFLYLVFEMLMGYEIFGGLLAGDYP